MMAPAVMVDSANRRLLSYLGDCRKMTYQGAQDSGSYSILKARQQARSTAM
jgi:hypothetical protein